jgi:hypothetical protein
LAKDGKRYLTGGLSNRISGSGAEVGGVIPSLTVTKIAAADLLPSLPSCFHRFVSWPDLQLDVLPAQQDASGPASFARPG